MIIKLNGVSVRRCTEHGQGQVPALPVRKGTGLLDIILDQVRHARAAYRIQLPLLFMNSFRTHSDTLDALARTVILPSPD